MSRQKRFRIPCRGQCCVAAFICGWVSDFVRRWVVDHQLSLWLARFGLLVVICIAVLLLLWLFFYFKVIGQNWISRSSTIGGVMHRFGKLSGLEFFFASWPALA